MKGKKYYSVVADNGLMVSNDWEHVLRMRKYFRGDKCKGSNQKKMRSSLLELNIMNSMSSLSISAKSFLMSHILAKT